MTVNSYTRLITKRHILGLVPFAFIVAFFVTCVITYPELIPHSKPFHLEHLPYCDRKFVPQTTEGNHTVVMWTRNVQVGGPSVNITPSGECEFQNCIFTADRDDVNSSSAIVFYDADLDIDDLPPRLPHQRWVLFSQEAPTTSRLSSDFDGMFNWTMSYSPKDDVYVPFFEMCRDGQRPLEQNFSSKEFAAVWFVDNCYPENLAYVNQLQLEFPVHIVGPCSPQGFYCTERHRCMDQLLPLYKFALVFEDALCTDFVTRRLQEILRYNVIPVVWGGAQYSAILPKESFVVASEYNKPKELARMLYRFRKDELFRKAINVRRGVRAASVDWTCRLCGALNRRKRESSGHAHRTLAADRLKAGRCRVWKRGFFRTYRPSVGVLKGLHKE